jgi:hypothetical protein
LQKQAPKETAARTVPQPSQVLDETDGHFKEMVDVIVGKFKLSAEVSEYCK